MLKQTGKHIKRTKLCKNLDFTGRKGRREVCMVSSSDDHYFIEQIFKEQPPGSVPGAGEQTSNRMDTTYCHHYDIYILEGGDR